MSLIRFHFWLLFGNSYFFPFNLCDPQYICHIVICSEIPESGINSEKKVRFGSSRKLGTLAFKSLIHGNATFDKTDDDGTMKNEGSQRLPRVLFMGF